MNTSHDRHAPREARHLSFISEFTTDIQHVSGSDNAAADALSRSLNTSDREGGLTQEPTGSSPSETLQPTTTAAISLFPQAAVPIGELIRIQLDDLELRDLLRDHQPQLLLEEFHPDGLNGELFCDVSTGKPRPYVPKPLRKEIFEGLHSLAHPGIKATVKLVSDRYVWPAMNKDIRSGSRSCFPCQKAKVSRHTQSPLQPFEPPSARFSHVHVDIVGPLPVSSGKRYLLTMVDRFTRWMEVAPLEDITSGTVAEALVATWVSRFGAPSTITTDRGRQFESATWRSLMASLGARWIHTSSFHPQGNGMVERTHRHLKAAIMSRDDPHSWMTALPVVLLGIRAAMKSDLGCSSADLVFGTPLRLPGEFIDPSTISNTPDPSSYAVDLRECLDQLRPVQPRAQRHRKSFIFKDLPESSHVFVRVGAYRRSLQPPYEGPYPVVKRTPKWFTIRKRGALENVHVDRLKPAFVPAPEEEFSGPGQQASTQQRQTSSRRTPPAETDQPDWEKEGRKLPGTTQAWH